MAHQQTVNKPPINRHETINTKSLNHQIHHRSTIAIVNHKTKKGNQYFDHCIKTLSTYEFNDTTVKQVEQQRSINN